MTPADRTPFLDLSFDRLDLDQVLAWIAARDRTSQFAYIVTPNVDHMVRLPRLDPLMRRVYAEADLCLCDSRILVRLARTCGIDLTLVPGSDLTAALFARGLTAGRRVALIGGGASYGDRLRALHPSLDIVQHVPPMGLLRDPAARADAIAFAETARADVVLLAVGSPQQELLAHEMRANGRVTGTGLCIGASVDFLVGTEARAPHLVQQANLEWAWRLARNPRRMAHRYLVEDPAIFAMTWRWARKHRRGAGGSSKP